MSVSKRPILVASNVLIDPTGKILMGLRAESLRWEVSGGKVEDETLVQAAIREHEEETGMTLLGTPRLLGWADVTGDGAITKDQRFVCVFLLWEHWHGFPRLNEGKHLRWAWVAPEDLPPLEAMTQGTRVLVTGILPDYLVGKEEVQPEAEDPWDATVAAAINGNVVIDTGDVF